MILNKNFKKFIFILLITNIYVINSAKNTDKCESCDKLVKNLIKNLERTAKGNFGGGNTDWEDRKLGNYLTSETRFEEILENICDDSECHSDLEEYEDYLFDWFKNKQNLIKSQLYSHFCIKTLKNCCPKDTYGNNCSPCPKNLNKTCSGNGQCDGDGKRKGNGNCTCNEGYTGQFCELCKSGYYLETQNDQLIKCTACHRSCKSTCIKDGADGCVDCKDGWLFNEGKCEDIDECKVSSTTCQEDEYCVNNDGSFSCLKCDKSCKSCIATGSDKCINCNNGYEKIDDKCVDINECERDATICDSNECVNTIGSYDCKVKTEEQTEQIETEKRNTETTPLSDADKVVPNQEKSEL